MLPVIVGLVVICIGLLRAGAEVPVVAQPGSITQFAAPDRHDRARHRAGAAARRDRPVGRLGQGLRRRRHGRAGRQPGHRMWSAMRRPASWSAWRSVCSTPCSTPSSACRASCSPWPACWRSRGAALRAGQQRHDQPARDSWLRGLRPRPVPHRRRWPTSCWPSSCWPTSARGCWSIRAPHGGRAHPAVAATRAGEGRRCSPPASALLTYYLDIDRGWSYLWLFFGCSWC